MSRYWTQVKRGIQIQKSILEKYIILGANLQDSIQYNLHCSHVISDFSIKTIRISDYQIAQLKRITLKNLILYQLSSLKPNPIKAEWAKGQLRYKFRSIV